MAKCHNQVNKVWLQHLMSVVRLLMKSCGYLCTIFLKATADPIQVYQVTAHKMLLCLTQQLVLKYVHPIALGEIKRCVID